MTEQTTEAHELKLRIARCQLGTALALFLENKDPISVHSLACSGGEILDDLAKHIGQERFADHILETHSARDEQEIREFRNEYWNAFKHFSKRKGTPREDQGLISNFSDIINDHSLFVGWWDYQKLTGILPLEAHAFQLWYYALYEEKVRPYFDFSMVRKMFPAITAMRRTEQKRKLRRVIAKHKSDFQVMGDPLTEKKKLMADA